MSKNKVADLPPPEKLGQLQEEHMKLYQDFLPTLDAYQEMAKRALGLQIDIFRLRLKAQYPEATFKGLSIVSTITARETPVHLDKLIAEVARLGVVIKEIIYDERTFAFYLLADPNAVS